MNNSGFKLQVITSASAINDYWRLASNQHQQQQQLTIIIRSGSMQAAY